MLSALLRLVIIVIVVLAAVAFFAGYRFGDRESPAVAGDRAVPPMPGVVHPEVDNRPVEEPAVGTTGDGRVLDRDRARATGAEVGERAADALNELGGAVADGKITTTIKSKMALDEYVRALDIDVDTSGGVVTLTGVVSTVQQRDRALALARETSGVRSVVDRLQVR